MDKNKRFFSKDFLKIVETLDVVLSVFFRKNRYDVQLLRFHRFPPTFILSSAKGEEVGFGLKSITFYQNK